MNMFRAFMELDSLYEDTTSKIAWVFTGTATFWDDLNKTRKTVDIKTPIKTLAVSEAKALSNIQFNIRQKFKLNKDAKVTLSDYELRNLTDEAEASKQTIKRPTCEICETELTDGGFCPNCDDGKDDLINESQENTRTKSIYSCTECGYEVEMYDDEFDYCCPNCHDHHGGFGKCEEALTESDELSTEHAVMSVVDRIKQIYEAGLFNKLPIGRDKAFTLDISGPDKERLTGYFKKQPEFNYELNNDSGIISHEFISDKYDIEVFDTFIQMYRLPQNESLLEEQEKVYSKKNGDYIIKNDNGGYTAFSSHNIYLGHIEEEDPKEAQFKFEKNKFDEFFTESMFDATPNKSNWVVASGNSINNGNAQVTTVKSSANSTSQTPNIVTIVYDNKAHKLRARANDGVHGEANVAFPNNLRTSEGLQYEVEELVWNGKNYRAIGDITPVNTTTNTYNNINENKENYKMNFQTILEELDKLYEEEQFPVEKPIEKALAEDIDEEAPIDDEPIADAEAIEAPVDETESEETPKQLILECDKCGALVLKDEAEVKVDEATDLANVEDECAFCEEAAGYKIIGTVAPYEVAEDDSIEETDDVSEDDIIEESLLTEGKIKDSLKKIATRLGADGATVVRSLAELISDLLPEKAGDALYDAAEYVENKAVLQALLNGNDKVLNTCTKEDIDELVQEIEAYKEEKANKSNEK